jgi:hypothetical protein
MATRPGGAGGRQQAAREREAARERVGFLLQQHPAFTRRGTPPPDAAARSNADERNAIADFLQIPQVDRDPAGRAYTPADFYTDGFSTYYLQTHRPPIPYPPAPSRRMHKSNLCGFCTREGRDTCMGRSAAPGSRFAIPQPKTGPPAASPQQRPAAAPTLPSPERHLVEAHYIGTPDHHTPTQTPGGTWDVGQGLTVVYPGAPSSQPPAGPLTLAQSRALGLWQGGRPPASAPAPIFDDLTRPRQHLPESAQSYRPITFPTSAGRAAAAAPTYSSSSTSVTARISTDLAYADDAAAYILTDFEVDFVPSGLGGRNHRAASTTHGHGRGSRRGQPY